MYNDIDGSGSSNSAEAEKARQATAAFEVDSGSTSAYYVWFTYYCCFKASLLSSLSPRAAINKA